jgi:hypothetical protein
MTKFARLIDGAWAEITDDFTANILVDGEYDEAQFPADWPEKATSEERQALGLFAIVEPVAPPADQKPIGLSLIDEGGVPTRIWVLAPYPLEEAQAICWERAITYREARMSAGCMTPFGRVDTDDAPPKSSKLKINGLCTAAAISKIASQPFSSTFTLEDNTTVDLDADQVITLGMAVTAYIQACQDAGSAIRTAIYAATTPEAAFAVDITAGYP